MLSSTADNLYWLARYVERAEYLAFLQQAEQRFKGQHGFVVDPAQCKQWRSSGVRAADLHVIEFARPKVHALAHHHAHPQRLRGHGQLGKTRDKTLLVDAQDIVITGGDPVENMLEVL